MKKRSKFLLVAMLLTGFGAFTSCQEDAPEINYTTTNTTTITVINDFTKVVEAINNGSIKQAEAIAKLTEAIDNMKASQDAKLKAIADEINSQKNTLETKLQLLEAAMNAQTVAFNEKMALLEDAIKGNTDMIKDKGQLIADAIDAIKGSMEDKLKEIRDAIETAGNNTAEKLDLIKGAMEAQTVAFNEKMKLLEDAIKGNTDMIKDKGQLIADAIDAIQGSTEDKLKEIRDAIETSGKNTAEKLDLIKGAMEAHTLAFNEKMQLLEDAIKGLDCKTQIEAISEALNNILTQMQADANTQGEIKTQLENAVTAINNLKEQVENGNKDEKTALAEIIAKLEALKGSIGGGSGSGSGSGSGGGSGSGSGGDPGTGGGSGSGSSGSFIPSTLKTLTQSNYFQWDAVDPVNGTNTDYNTTTTTGYATNSCKDASTANEMCIYLGNGVYWDNGDAGTNQQSYTIEGTTYNKGLWVKKWEHCNKILSALEVKSAPLFNTGRPDASEIDKYFFLPACGYYPSGSSLRDAGTDGYYWSSTPTIGDANNAYYLGFNSSNAYVSNEDGVNRKTGLVPMPKL